ncbi:MAG: tRNA (adenosine(37)-N6)-threonylcarbamoyltransferase complex dimerization subunit type 1 TsaB [Gammaproteobacteria bacterium RIFCSPHIGHO2_02_FULL_39_13]|nr:MAG: tRNA (adenosine(37)-N6)-threonylcarbamoyltransferase complex dimerization subunit type 1 TsaB [Gammaproteobacteria bacterium RIFCSPHIGHO2_02_FULL_39_13]OGT49619.1 MAG: tRNA (adenosine(37)-N6)-threonylcarbamoyltransferase complex dimerization subunit type 1 TsaB [Gammaproteobacteria bacterium RIFCSPHIGHO2_12_FULL_39_24]
MPMNLLSFDTATHACTAALYVDEKIYSRFQIVPNQHAALLLSMIQDLLNEANITRTELTAIAFGCGPGSFMGVRLATGFAQGLAFGLHIPVISISTLQIIAQVAYEKTGAKKIISGWDARMHEIYWGIYASDDNGVVQPQQEDTLCAPSQLDTKLISEVGCIFAGNAWQYFSDNLPSDVSIYPEAKAMLTIALSKYLRGEITSPEDAHPHYVRHHVVHNHK